MDLEVSGELARLSAQSKLNCLSQSRLQDPVLFPPAPRPCTPVIWARSVTGDKQLWIRGSNPAESAALTQLRNRNRTPISAILAVQST